jgi:hypothetical protein
VRRLGALAAAIAFVVLPARADAATSVTITPPASLTAVGVVRFSPAVTGVTAENVVIRITGTSSSLPAGVSCRGGDGAPVPCVGPGITQVRLNPISPLVPGEAYTIEVNPSGAVPIVDGGGASVPRTAKSFHAPAEQQEYSAAATYRWAARRINAAYGGGYHTERTGGASVTYTFTGPSITWYTVIGTGQGKATMLIDGAARKTVNNYAPSARYRVPRSLSDLGAGTHRLTVLVLGTRSPAASGTSVAVDAFRTAAGLDAEPAVAFRWDETRASAASGGRYVRTDVPGADVAFRYRGRGIDWYAVTGPTRGKVDVYVDDVKRATVDNYTGSLRYGVKRSIAALTDAQHVMRIVVRSDRNISSTGRYRAIDRFVVPKASITSFRHLGAWDDLWDYALDPSAATATMASHGVRTIYLQTARWNSEKDIVDAAKVSAWIEAAHARKMRIVGWYLTAYDEWMTRDLRRTLAIAFYRTASGQRFDALAIDIEYKGQTEDLTEFNDGIRTHLARVRAGVGTAYPVGAIVPAPRGMALSPSSWEGFPWGSIGRYADVVLPMGYWSYRTDCPANPAHCPYRYTVNNVNDSRSFTRLPVHVIGGVADAVTASEVGDFARGASDARAYGASLYDYRTTASSFWSRLAPFGGS